MLKTLFRKNIFIPVIVSAVLFGVFISCVRIPSAKLFPSENVFFLFREMSTFDNYEKGYHSEVIMSIFNVFLFIAFAAKTFASDIDIAKNYMFIRLKSNGKWFLYKTLQCAAISAVSAVLYNLTLFLMSLTVKAEYDFSLFIKHISLSIYCSFLITFVFSMLSNVLSLRFKPHISVTGTVGLFFFLAVFSGFLTKEQLQFSIVFYYFISSPFLGNHDFYFYPYWTYILIITLLALFEVIAGGVIVKKTDNL